MVTGPARLASVSPGAGGCLPVGFHFQLTGRIHRETIDSTEPLPDHQQGVQTKRVQKVLSEGDHFAKETATGQCGLVHPQGDLGLGPGHLLTYTHITSHPEGQCNVGPSL